MKVFEYLKFDQCIIFKNVLLFFLSPLCVDKQTKALQTNRVGTAACVNNVNIGQNYKQNVFEFGNTDIKNLTTVT